MGSKITVSREAALEIQLQTFAMLHEVFNLQCDILSKLTDRTSEEISKEAFAEADKIANELRQKIAADFGKFPPIDLPRGISDPQDESNDKS